MSPLTETAYPNVSPGPPPFAVSLRASEEDVHPPSGRRNAYTAPESPDSWGSAASSSRAISLPCAPTTMNSPLTDTACPNRSPSDPSDAVSFHRVRCLHPSRVGLGEHVRCACPIPALTAGSAHHYGVSPARKRRVRTCRPPRRRMRSASPPMMCPPIPHPGMVKTYAAPGYVPVFATGAPTTTLSPIMETACPNRSPAAPPETVSFAGVGARVHPDSGLVYT